MKSFIGAAFVAAAVTSTESARVVSRSRPHALKLLHESAILGDSGLSYLNCSYTLEVLHLQDVSHSFDDDLDNLRALMPDILESLYKEYPGSKFAMSTFTDKPIPTAGYWDSGRVDFCYKNLAGFDASLQEIQNELNDAFAAGGDNWPEAQLDALAIAAASKYPGFSPPEKMWDDEYGLPIVRTIIMATDAMPNFAGSAAKFVKEHNENNKDDQWVVPRPSDLLTNPQQLDKDPNADCPVRDYISLEDLGQILRDKRIIPAVLLAPAGYECDHDPSGWCQYKELRDLAAERNDPEYRDPILGLKKVYSELFDDMGVEGVIVSINSESSDIYTKIFEALQGVEDVVCKPPTTTTTTASPSTAKPTTTATAEPPTTTTTTAPTASTTTAATKQETTLATTGSPATTAGIQKPTIQITEAGLISTAHIVPGTMPVTIPTLDATTAATAPGTLPVTVPSSTDASTEDEPGCEPCETGCCAPMKVSVNLHLKINPGEDGAVEVSAV